MAKVMLVIDDYTELIFAENLLKRMGFDVLSLNRDNTFNEALIGFFPDVLITSFKGKSVDGLKLRETIKRKSANSRIIALAPPAQATGILEETRTRFDGFIEAPIQPVELLKLISRLLKVDSASLLDKFEKLNKARAFSRDNEPRLFKEHSADQGIVATVMPSVKSHADGTPLTPRELKYEAFLSNAPEAADKVLSHSQMSKAVKEQAANSPIDEDLEKRLLAQKQEFVRALMQNKKS